MTSYNCVRRITDRRREKNLQKNEYGNTNNIIDRKFMYFQNENRLAEIKKKLINTKNVEVVAIIKKEKNTRIIKLKRNL